MRFAAVFAVLFTITAVACTRDPYDEYAVRIVQSADSAYYAFTVWRTSVGVNAPTDTSAWKPIVEAATASEFNVTRHAGDFAAYEPPPEFARLHDQIVGALKRLTAASDSTSRYMRRCAGTGHAACMRRYGNAALAAGIIFGADADIEYAVARERAARFLAEKRAFLPDLIEP